MPAENLNWQIGLSSDEHALRLDHLQAESKDELVIVKEEFETERAIMIDQHNLEMNDIADILFAMEQNFHDKESEARGEFQSLTDEIRNKVFKSGFY